VASQQCANSGESHVGTLRSARRCVERLSTGQEAAGAELLELEDELVDVVDVELVVESDFAGEVSFESPDFFAPLSRESVR
jgi:hypothetical protein